MAGEWKETTLGQLVDFLSGGTPSKDCTDYWGGSIPWVSAKDMKRLRLDDSEDHVTEAGVANGTKLIPAGTVLLLARGMTLLNDVPICIARRPMSFNQDVKALRPKTQLNEAFLPYLLLGNKARLLSLVDLAGHGTGRLNSDVLKALDVLLPPISEQRAIAHILGMLDDKIELNRRMADTLEAMARALFKSCFVDFDPVRAKAEGRPTGLPDEVAALFPAELDEAGVPVGWEEEALYDQADWVNGAAYKNMHFSDAPDALPVVKIAELKNGVTEQTKRTNTQLGEKFKIDDGELLFSWSGNPDTSIDAFIWTRGPAWLNQHVFAVRHNGKQQKPFLYFMLKHFMPDFARIARDKQTTGLGHVTKADMQRMRVCIGEPQVRRAFDAIAGPMFERLVATMFESDTLISLRDTLLSRLISGELRIRDAESAIEAA